MIKIITDFHDAKEAIRSTGSEHCFGLMPLPCMCCHIHIQENEVYFLQ